MHAAAAGAPTFAAMTGRHEGLLFGGLLLPVVAGLLFTRSLGGTFVYDDHQCIVENPHVATGSLSDAMTAPFWHADFWGTN